MATRKLAEYGRKRRFAATPEPPPAEKAPARRRTKLPRFVVQEHHATRLHWDFRLEHDGVLVSWAVPKGIPQDPKQNHLAVHVEDHPLDYIDFAGEIPRGNYGAGQVSIWDHGTYETEKWWLGPDAAKQEVRVVLHGGRLEGRYVLFQTNGKNWMIHRMDPPQDPERVSMPGQVVPMMAKLASGIPSDEAKWGFEFKWDGIRAVVYSAGGTLRIQSRNLEDITRRYPELRPLSESLGSHEVVLDGEIVALDSSGRPSFEVLQQRMGLNAESEIRRKMREVPAVYMVFDVIYLDGRSLLKMPYRERRGRLEGLELNGPAWQVPPWVAGDGEALRQASARNGLEGIMAKRLDSPYEPGRRSGAWLKIKNHLRQEFVICGWEPGEGRRAGLPGSLLLGYYDGDELVYAGKVGTGFTEKTLEVLKRKLEPLKTDRQVFDRRPSPVPRTAQPVEPKLVCEVEFNEWTKTGQLRAPSFKGFRTDKSPRDVMREGPVG
ncbi:MAG TPA: non-homologous end-joining DNA ligase [Candidatus Dormibacteraeota bacterium]